jgi:XTP/dITP diphosphohydrolase
MRRIILATRNPHKAREFQEILGARFELSDLSAYPEIPETEESGQTFAENAALKALVISKRFPHFVIGDDSGLEVAALEGRPGVFSARYAGLGATDLQNVDKLLSQLAQTKARTARFVCVLVLARGGQVVNTFEGIVQGTIINAPRGSEGFGYDPVFVPDGFSETLAELPREIKNRISHRASAVEKLVHHLKTQRG